MGPSKNSRVADFKGRPVYVIDDDADVGRSLHFLLETRQAAVTSFHSAREFLEAVDSLSPSPLIVDVRMPRMDGLQLIVELSKRKVAWPAIVLSGHGDVAIAVKAVKLGASDFLEKPVVAEELETCLENAFRTLDNQLSTLQLGAQATQLWALLTPREVTVLPVM